MKILDTIRETVLEQDKTDEKIIDLSDKTKYPASVLADMNYHFALGDDDANFIWFVQKMWTKPTFHWGWDDYTHEEAVNSDFLFRAVCAMNSQHRKRRDAMIAAEGCRFVWKNKSVEPIPGLLSGEQLCDYMNRSLEKSLDNIKSINSYDDREKRRWQLTPTYDDLIAELEKDEDDRDFYVNDLGCGMMRFKNRAWGNKQIFIVNTTQKKAYPIADANGKLVGFTLDDIDWDNVNQLENNGDAKRLQTSYAFSVTDYKDGIARVNWMLYPDGRYFADEYGFGMEDNKEVNVSAYIDTQCRVLVKFQSNPSAPPKNYRVPLKM